MAPRDAPASLNDRETLNGDEISRSRGLSLNYIGLWAGITGVAADVRRATASAVRVYASEPLG
jgi:hypothetical protein